MMEPSAYLLLSGILFGIGVAGVVARKNVLIILMSVEIMLNAVNVAFIAVGSHLGVVCVAWVGSALALRRAARARPA